MGFSYVAVLATITLGRAFEYYEVHDCAINEENFAAFLRSVADFYEGEDIVIVMDNLKAHIAPSNKTLMDELGIEYIYNVPYSPDYNAIETPFSQVKRKFKELKLLSLLNGEKLDVKQAIKKCFSAQSS